MSIPFTKMHGTGNDFAVIDTSCTKWNADPKLIASMADRSHGIGFDQLLVITPNHHPQKTALQTVGYRIFNADGSEAEQCGNGARCVALYLQHHYPCPLQQWTLEGLAGLTQLHVTDSSHITVDMGIPRLDPKDIPFNAPAQTTYYSLQLNGEELQLGVINIGNPHAILQVPDLNNLSLLKIGQEISTHPAFPNGTNVGFMQVEDHRHLKLRVYERGAGGTLACGSGACAAAAIAQLWGLCGSDVTVSQKGGNQQINWQGPGHHITQTGAAAFVFTGLWDPSI